MDWDYYYRLYYDDDDDSENDYTYTTPSNMAEGGYDPNDAATDKTPLIPSAGDDDDDDTTVIDWDEIDLKRVPGDDDDRRNTFEPTASSTPAGSEHIPLKTMTRLPPEKQGASAETSFTKGV